MLVEARPVLTDASFCLKSSSTLSILVFASVVISFVITPPSLL
jgi:hypothetical protein